MSAFNGSLVSGTAVAVGAGVAVGSALSHAAKANKATMLRTRERKRDVFTGFSSCGFSDIGAKGGI
jgi:hypothetical protein